MRQPGLGQVSCTPRDQSSIRIGLAWHSLTSGNLGIGALTAANHALACEVAKGLGLVPQFVVYSPRAGETTPLALENAEVVEIDRRAVTGGRLLASVASLDCMLDIGAGDSFADIYGPRRFAFLWLTKAMALYHGVPLVLAPQTIGPFDKRTYRMFARHILRRSTLVYGRDGQSVELAARLAGKTRVQLAVDVAFELPFDDQSMLRGGDRTRVGVNASGLLFHEAEAGTNRFGLSYDYAAMTRRLIERLCSDGRNQVFLVPHATSSGDPKDDDGRLADRLASEFPALSRVPDFEGPSQAKSFISSLDYLVAARMHACIAALSSGTPVMPVAYSRKFSGLFDMLGYHDRIPERGLDVEEAVTMALKGLEGRRRLSDELDASVARVRPLLDEYRAGLRQVFSAASGGLS